MVGYLKKTKDLCLYQPLNIDAQPQWTFFSDSDFAGNAEATNKRRSQSGYVALNGTAPIIWGSKPSSVTFSENTVAAHPRIGETHADVSSGAVETYAAANATFEFLHLSYVMDEMDIDFPEVMELQLDNTTAEAFMNNTVRKSKLKHIDCRQEWVKMLRDKSIVVPKHVDTNDNLADFFTKILGKLKFIQLRDRMMVAKNFK